MQGIEKEFAKLVGEILANRWIRQNHGKMQNQLATTDALDNSEGRHGKQKRSVPPPSSS
jgi:hypothetical protein